MGSTCRQGALGFVPQAVTGDAAASDFLARLSVHMPTGRVQPVQQYGGRKGAPKTQNPKSKTLLQ